MPTGPGVIPPSNPPPSFPDDYANLSAINGNNVITTNEDSVTVSGISDGIGASIVTYLVPYEGGEGRPGAGSSIISESNTVTVTDLGSKDANGNEIGTYSATLPTTGIAPGIYVAESYLEFPNGGNTVYEDSGAGEAQIVSIDPPSTQTLPAQIELSGTNAEITTNGQFLVYTAINEYNEPEITGHVYERNLQTGAEVDLTATGQSPTGVFAVNHTASSAGNYPTFTSANGAETFSTIEDFDLNPDGGGYNPLPVVTNAQGDQSVIGGIGANKFDVGAATAVSDDGSVVLSTETYEVQYGATGASYLEMADPQIYVTFLGTQTASGPDVFSDIVQATSGPLAGEYLWSDAANWSAGIPASGASATLSPAYLEIDDIATLSLASLDTGKVGADIAGSLLTVDTVTIGSDAAFQADSEKTGGAVTVIIGTVSGSNAFFEANGANTSLEVTDTVTQAEQYWATDGGRVILASLPSDSGFEYRDGIGTLALVAPGATIAGSVEGISPGDVLELPGTVSHIDFGNTLDSVTTMSVTTSSGIYVFAEAGIDGVKGYTAGLDASTGLEAITFTSTPTAPSGPDVFSDAVAASSGQFLWSNAGNWSQGIPGTNGNVSLAGSGIDDLAALSLSTLISNGKVTSVDGAVLAVSTLVADSASGLVANSAISGGSATVSVLLGTVTGSGGLFVADGAHASIEILSGDLPGEIYQAEAGGRIILDALSSGSNFGFVGDGTLALVQPGSVTSGLIEGVNAGDVLELPGSTADSVIFGVHSLDIVTNSGTYDFTNVTFGSGSLEYSASVDSATGLEAITFTPTPQDVFQAKDLFGGGGAPQPFTADYFWSDAGNWVSGSVPQNGDDVTANAFNEVDDTNLSLSTLNLGAGAEVLVTGNLMLGALDSAGFLIAQGNYNYTEGVFPATITVDSIIASQDEAFVGADGIGGVAIINATLNSSSFVWADGGGFLELTTAPDAGQLSYFDPLYSDYFGGAGTIALTHPGAVNAAELRYVRPGDVLELPGTAVSSLHFGTASLTIATNAGDYIFSDFETLQPVNGYTAAIDPATGLVAITFTGPTNPGVDVFSSNYDQGAPELEGELWTTDGNWSALVPRDGAAVELEYDTGTVSVDNIDNLSLSSMAVDSSFQLLVAATLEAGALNIAAGGDVDAQSPFTIQGDVVNAGELRSDGLVTIGGSVTGSGNIDIAGEVFIHGGVAASQSLSFLGGKLALFNPGATTGAAIKNLAPGDVLELPGTAVLGIDFETGAMQVTTSSGIYDFTNVSDSSPVFGDIASYDAATGLEAITFSEVDIFSDHIATGGTYLWSSASNWSAGVPTAGASVSIASASTDDIASLSLNDLSVTASELTVTHELSVRALYVAAGAEIDDLGSFNATGDTVNDGIIATDPSLLTFDSAVTGNGTIEIGADSDVIFASSVAASETVKFLSNTGTLTIDDPAGFAASVIGSGVTIVNGGTVAAPADAKPSLSSHGGSLTAGSAADEFTLNLGSVTQGGAALSAVLDLSNGAAAPADPLGSGFSISGTSFGNTGFTRLEGIAAGATVIAGSISLQTGTAGTFSETIVLSPVETESNRTTVALAKETVNVTGIITPPTGSAQGDVHLVTFDGLHYNFQAAGDFVLARSTLPGDSFQVQMQAMQYQQIAGTSVADEYAAQLGNDRIAFTARANGAIGVTVDGVADTAISHAGARQIFSGGTLVATAANKFLLEWNTGEQLAVSAEIPLGQTYLDASISLPSKDGPGSVQGLMGSDSGQANDFALADGTVLKNPSASELLGKFADSWRVTSETSILGDVAPVTANSLTSPLSAMSFEPAATLPAAATGKIMTGGAASTQFGQALPWLAFTGGGAAPSSDTIPKQILKDATGVADLSGGAYGVLTSVLQPASANPNALHAANDGHGGTFRLGA